MVDDPLLLGIEGHRLGGGPSGRTRWYVVGPWSWLHPTIRDRQTREAH